MEVQEVAVITIGITNTALNFVDCQAVRLNLQASIKELFNRKRKSGKDILMRQLLVSNEAILFQMNQTCQLLQEILREFQESKVDTSLDLTTVNLNLIRLQNRTAELKASAKDLN